MTISKLSVEQHVALLQDLASGRISTRSQSGKQFSYLEAWDVRRTLIRIFGFGGFSTRIVKAECVVDRPAGGDSKNFDVAYLVQMELVIPQLDAVYAEAAVGDAHVPNITQAHDFALKSACSDALKRCAANLGTQFGLSLYNKDSRAPRGADVVRMTLVNPIGGETPPDGRSLPTDDVVVPEDQPEPETSAAAPESTPEQGGEAVPTNKPDVDEWLGKLRAVYDMTTSAQRLRAVAELKSAVTADFLAQTVTIKAGTFTLERLADKAVSDAMAKEPADG